MQIWHQGESKNMKSSIKKFSTNSHINQDLFESPLERILPRFDAITLNFHTRRGLLGFSSFDVGVVYILQRAFWDAWLSVKMGVSAIYPRDFAQNACSIDKTASHAMPWAHQAVHSTYIHWNRTTPRPKAFRYRDDEHFNENPWVERYSTK